MLGNQITIRYPRSHRVLDPHHNGICEPSDKHHGSNDKVHGRYAFVVYCRYPLTPEITPFFKVRNTSHHGKASKNNKCKHCKNNNLLTYRLIEIRKYLLW